MSDPLVTTVTDDDGTERFVAAGGPSDTAAAPELARPSETPKPADPNDPEADQPAEVITEEASDAAAADAANGDGVDTKRGKRRS